MNDELLKYAVENGMINVSYVQEQIKMKKRKELLEKHPYKIWEGNDGKWYTYIPNQEKGRILKKRINKENLEEIWNSKRHKEVKEASNRKWMEGACKNCRAISYNRIINETIDQMPAYFDPFI